MSRYAFEGRRAGETYYTPHGRIQTHSVDGGTALNEEQLEYFQKNGPKPVLVDDEAPDFEVSQQQRIQDQAADNAYHEAVAAKAAAGEYGQAPKTLKTFHDIAHGLDAVNGADLADHAKNGDDLVPRNSRRTLGDPVIVPTRTKKDREAAPPVDPATSVEGDAPSTQTAVADGDGNSNKSAI